MYRIRNKILKYWPVVRMQNQQSHIVMIQTLRCNVSLEFLPNRLYFVIFIRCSSRLLRMVQRKNARLVCLRVDPEMSVVHESQERTHDILDYILLITVLD